MKLYDLRYEHLTNPIGVDETTPRFSWKLTASTGEKGLVQTAYQIQTAETKTDLQNGNTLWDSGKVESDASILVPYGGPALESRQRIYWRVKVWGNQQQESEWSETAWFEMGLLDEADWKASWIEPEEDFDPEDQQPASYTRKEFNIPDGSVKKARLYITSLGFYEAWINGQRVGEYCFAPTRTNYQHILNYQTYDVKALLAKGENAIGVILGDGWLRNKSAIDDARNVHGERLALLVQLEITYENGEKTVICSDDSWKATQNGPMRINDAKEGETYDAQLEMPGWDKPNFDSSNWHDVRVTEGNGVSVSASNSVPMVEKERFTPVLTATPDGSTVLDFGQNIAGYISFKVHGEAGHTVKIIHGESLNNYGNFSVKHLNMSFGGRPTSRFQEVHYILKGTGEEYYKTKFSVFGFRYIKLVDWPCEVNPEDFTAFALYSDMDETASFQCSNPMVNQLFENTLWSQKGNFLDAPTDCPTRERAGWSGDAQIFVRTGTYLMDTSAFFKKWLKDMAVLQREDGTILNQIPATSDPYDANHIDARTAGSAGWGDAAVIIPWTMWKMTGDIRFIEESWPMMKAWVDYEMRHAKETNPNREPVDNPYAEYTWDTCFHFGEWLEADRLEKRMVLEDEDLAAGMTPPPPPPGGAGPMRLLELAKLGNPEVATAYFAYSAGLLAECAQALGKEEEAKTYKKASEMAKKAYRFLFVQDGVIDSDRQAHYVRPLALGILEGSEAKAAADTLAELVISKDYHIGTGFLSTVFICDVLAQNGHLDTAYRLLEQTSMPSWLYSITKGATTIWERWDGIDEDNRVSASLNHYSYGAVSGWLIEGIAGIKMDEETPGFKHFFITPQPGGSLTTASATYESPYGEIASRWKVDGGTFTLDVTVPANTTATIVLPDGSEPFTIGSGAYQYSTALN